jgi:hypothetical protein
VYDDVGDGRDSAADALFDGTRAPVRVGQRSFAPERKGEERDDPVIGTDEAEVSRGGAGFLYDSELDGSGINSDLLACRRLFQRLEVRLHRLDLAHLGKNRLLDLLGDRVRAIERELAGELQVK